MRRTILLAGTVILAVIVVAGLSETARAAPKPPSAEMKQKIAEAVPEQATVKPAKPRKLLVYCKCRGFTHGSIPTGAEALRIMGEKTGAFQAVVSSDESILTPEKLAQFDAVCLNNTTGRFSDEEMKTLADFVAGGKGLVGIHGATDSSMGEVFGGRFSGHPWHTNVGVKIDDPGHPLCKVFHGEGFMVVDEIYQFKKIYSRENLRVLLSLDMNKTEKRGQREDQDYAVAWVKAHGNGRVFYCSLGHRHEIFWNPPVLRFYLDGVQFALGDLKCDVTPSAKLSPQPKPALVPE